MHANTYIDNCSQPAKTFILLKVRALLRLRSQRSASKPYVCTHKYWRQLPLKLIYLSRVRTPRTALKDLQVNRKYSYVRTYILTTTNNSQLFLSSCAYFTNLSQRSSGKPHAFICTHKYHMQNIVCTHKYSDDSSHFLSFVCVLYWLYCSQRPPPGKLLCVGICGKMWTSVHLYTYIFVYTHMNIFVCAYICTSVCIYMDVNASTCFYMYEYIYVHIYTHTYMYI